MCYKPDMVAYTFNPSIWEKDCNISVAQIHNETLSQKIKEKVACYQGWQAISAAESDDLRNHIIELTSYTLSSGLRRHAIAHKYIFKKNTAS